METTREQVLRFVRGRREATVAQLAAAFGLSQQAVRRHIDTLRAEGLIDSRLERHGVGRPNQVFFATELGEELSPTYVHALSRLVRRLAATDQLGAEDRSGRQVLETAFAGIAVEVANDHRAEVRGQTLDERVAQVSRALESEGIVDGWRKEDDVFHLHNGECPYLRLAEMTDAPCHADRQSIELLVGVAVEQTSRIVDGAATCEYIVRPEPAQQKDP